MFLSYAQTNFSDECQETSSGSGIFIEKTNDYGFFTEPNLEENCVSNDFKVKPASAKKNKGISAKFQGFKKERKANHCTKENNPKNKGLDRFLDSFNLIASIEYETNNEIEEENLNKIDKNSPPSYELMQSIEKIIDSHFEGSKESENLNNFSKPLIEIIEEEEERKIFEEVPHEKTIPHKNDNILNLIPIKVNKKREEEDEDKSQIVDEEIASICDDLQKNDNAFFLKPRNSKPVLNYFIIEDENTNEILERKKKMELIALKKRNEIMVEGKTFSNRKTANLLSACFGKKPLFDEINERLFENQEILEANLFNEKKKIPKVYKSKSIVIDDNLLLVDKPIPLITEEIKTKLFINVFEKEKEVEIEKEKKMEQEKEKKIEKKKEIEEEKDIKKSFVKNVFYFPKGRETIFKNMEAHEMIIEPQLVNPVIFEKKKKIIKDKINHLLDLNIQKENVNNNDDSISFSNKSNEQIGSTIAAETQSDNFLMNKQHALKVEEHEEIDFKKLQISDKTIFQQRKNKNKNKKKLLQKQIINILSCLLCNQTIHKRNSRRLCENCSKSFEKSKENMKIRIENEMDKFEILEIKRRISSKFQCEIPNQVFSKKEKNNCKKYKLIKINTPEFIPNNFGNFKKKLNKILKYENDPNDEVCCYLLNLFQGNLSLCFKHLESYPNSWKMFFENFKC